MENKLQELTQRLYDEGLSKGRQEAETLVSDAQAQARKIVADARAEAERIVREAETRSADLQKNAMTELNLAGKQAVARLKQSIQEMVTARALGTSVGEAAMDPAFVRETLVAVCRNWQGSGAGNVTLSALLPESMRDKLDAEFERSVKESLGGGLEIAYSNGVKSGFRIGPKDGSFHINFTDDGFDALLGEYLRPKVSQVLYGTHD
ncbi:hypothetical protein LJC45_00645 [Alistipes sp. OttesenSCG-928-B03]|nr:hypothetical protein [Alistipes sp. OttesenSCG-928-B03]